MATPLSASVAALIWSQNPTWTAAQVRQRLFDSADSIDSLPCNSSLAGKLGKRINAFKAVETVSPPSPPVADFSASPTTGDAPLAVTFSDLSTGRVDSWAWDFGDGGTSSAQNLTHTYNTTGSYTVKLTVTGPGGTDENVKTNYITVSEPPEQYQAGVTSLKTGIYSRSGKTTVFLEQPDFFQGDEVVIQARVDDSANDTRVSNAVVVIGINGQEARTLTSGPSGTNGIAEARWKTSAPRRKNSGTKPGTYTATVNNVTASGYTWDDIRTTIPFTVKSK